VRCSRCRRGGEGRGEEGSRSLLEGGAERGAGASAGLLLVGGSSSEETSSLNRPACDAATTEGGGGFAGRAEASQAATEREDDPGTLQRGGWAPGRCGQARV